MDDEEVERQLSAVWGIGEWSAEMFLMFRLGRLDVFAPGDTGAFRTVSGSWTG